MSLNKVQLIGNLGAPPELKYLPSGQSVCEIRMATSETWNDASGQKQERTEWHRVVVWGKLAESCGKYLRKGSKIYAEGRIQTRSWDDKEGKKHYMTEIQSQRVLFLSNYGEDKSSPDGGSEPPASRAGSAAPPDHGRPPLADDDDIPF